MQAKLLVLVFAVVVVGANGSILKRNANPMTDYGSAIGDFVTNFIQNNLTDPLVLLPAESEPIDIDLEALSQEIIGDGQDPPIKGHLTLSDISVSGVHQISVDHSVFDLPSIVRPANIDIALANTELNLEGTYEIDAILMKLIPVKGNGKITLRITDLKAGVIGTLKLFPLPMKVDPFDYSLSLSVFQVNFENLVGGGDLSKTINEILNNLIATQLLPGLTDPASSLHASVRDLIGGGVNDAISTLTAQDLLDLLNGLLKP